MSAALDRIVALFPDAKPAGAGKWKARCPARSGLDVDPPKKGGCRCVR